MASVSRYNHAALPSPTHIRLLELRPSPIPSSPLTASILLTDLDDDNDGLGYEALSYTWGPPVPQEKLSIFDRSGNQRFVMITTTLASALRRFRQEKRARNIWVDAVCINQGDDAEKSMQIRLMSRIYREAVGVLVWLGDSERIRRSLACLAEWAQKGKRETAVANLRLKESLSELISSPWFGRRWIIQETVLNFDVLLCCGLSELTWSRLAIIVRGIPLDGKLLSNMPAVRRASTMFDLWRLCTLGDGPDFGYGLMTLLRCFDASDCSDPRDRIYALAGLANDVTFANGHTDKTTTVDVEFATRTPARLVIQADYTLPVHELYTKLAEAIYHRDTSHGLMWLLCHAGCRGSGATNLLDRTTYSPIIPSWVPDWRLRTNCWPLQYPLQSPSRFSKESGRQIRRLPDGRSIVPAHMRCNLTIPKGSSRFFSFLEQAHHLLAEGSWFRKHMQVQERPAGRLELLNIQWISAMYPSEPNYKAKRLWFAQTFDTLCRRHEKQSQLPIQEDSEGNHGQTTHGTYQAKRSEIIRTFACALAGGCFVDALQQHHRLHLQSLMPEDPLPDPASVAPEDLRWFRNVHHGSGLRGPNARERYVGQCLHFPDGPFASQMIRTVEQIIDWDEASANEDFAAIALGPFLGLVDKVMQGRLLFQADTNTQSTAALPGIILGVGPLRTGVDDKIVAFANGPERTNRINLLDSTFVVRRRAPSGVGLGDNISGSSEAHILSRQSPHPDVENQPWIPEIQGGNTSAGNSGDHDLEYTQTCGSYELIGDCWCAGTAAALKARNLLMFEDVMHNNSVLTIEEGHLQGQQPAMGWFKLVFC